MSSEWKTYLVNLVAQHFLYHLSHLRELLVLAHLSFLEDCQDQVDLQ